jgi:hypothetical protein
MDPLSLTASILAILKLSTSVVRYLTDVAGGHGERLDLRNEISSAYGPLHMLYERINDEEKRSSSSASSSLGCEEDPDVGSGKNHERQWLSSVLKLGEELGPLEQYMNVLEILQRNKEKYMNPKEKNKFTTVVKAIV